MPNVEWRDPELQHVIADTKTRCKMSCSADDESRHNDKCTAWLPPPVHGEYAIAVCSDLHYGSKHALPGAISDWFAWARAHGAMLGVCAGDVVAGAYEFLAYELTAHGAREQAYVVAESLPRAHNFMWHFIDGNHDYTHEKKTGYPFGETLVDVFARSGRTDLNYLGPRNATLKLELSGTSNHVELELWHPGGGGMNPLTPINRKIDSYSASTQPDILVVGHYHKALAAMHRDVHAIAAGTFEGKGSEFSKKLAGGPAIGGWVVKFGVTEHGAIRHWECLWRGYPDSPVKVNATLY